MKVKILEVATDGLIDALVRPGLTAEMPSIHDEWRFNFNKHIKAPNISAYVLVTEETLQTIEGCLLFQLVEKKMPYISHIEVAPHNKGKSKKYDFIAGCLLAFAFRQSLVQGKGDYRGFLLFDVGEPTEIAQRKLMGLYSQKYGAKRFMNSESTMVIADDDRHALIKKYLERATK